MRKNAQKNDLFKCYANNCLQNESGNPIAIDESYVFIVNLARYKIEVPFMLNIIQGSSKKEAVVPNFVQLLSDSGIDGYLYVGYPIFGTEDGVVQVDALLISQEIGVWPFNFIMNEEDGANYKDSQDDNYAKLQSKFLGNKGLISGRRLSLEIHPISYNARRINVEANESSYPVVTSDCLVSYLKKSADSLDEEVYRGVLSSIQAISSIRKVNNKRVGVTENSKGAKLKFLEDSIAVMDKNQSRAVLETANGVQRIRGLAGSGKTIVIASKAAYLHVSNENWRIAVSFNTRSLKEQFKRLITMACIEQARREPNWENLHVIHAWGAPGSYDSQEKNGIYFTFCNYYGIEYYDYSKAKFSFGNENPFQKVCEKAVRDAEHREKKEGLYDLILIDEAQDLSPAFLKMCYMLLKEPKRLVYAYDELQSLKLATLPSPEEIFGKNPEGVPLVRFEEDVVGKPRQDIILNCCYRNSRPVLVTAHALGFGIYRNAALGQSTGIVQMFNENHLWNDVGYDSSSGTICDGEKVVLSRNVQSSPEFLEKHSSIDDIIEFKVFDSIEDQNKWLAESIETNVRVDLLRPNDIVVVNPDPFTTRENVGPIRSLLYERGLNSHLAGVDTSPDIFYYDENSVVFSGIYRAKGNEAGMVYIINAHDCFAGNAETNIAVQRNRLFTAITRSKAWVRVLGVGESMLKLKEEFEKVKEKNFTLQFRYPTLEERKKLNLINRDRSLAEKNVVNQQNSNLTDFLKKLQEGAIMLEDLDPKVLMQLRDISKGYK